jgi:hypothetical protein
MKKLLGRRNLRAAAVASGLLALGATTAIAADQGGAARKSVVFKSRVVHAPSPSGSAGPVDSATSAAEALRSYGRWETLSAEQKREALAKLEKAFRLNRSDEGLTAVPLKSGTVSVDLQGRYQYIWLTRVNPDGTTSTACVTDFESARAFLQGGGRTPSRLEKE